MFYCYSKQKKAWRYRRKLIPINIVQYSQEFDSRQGKVHSVYHPFVVDKITTKLDWEHRGVYMKFKAVHLNDVI